MTPLPQRVICLVQSLNDATRNFQIHSVWRRELDSYNTYETVHLSCGKVSLICIKRDVVFNDL